MWVSTAAGPWGRFLQSLCTTLCCKTCLVPGGAGGTWEESLNRRAETMKLGFLRVEWRQFTRAGNPDWFHVSVHFGALLLGVCKVADACKGKAMFSQLFLILENCWTISGVYASLIGKNYPESLPFCLLSWFGPWQQSFQELTFLK